MTFSEEPSVTSDISQSRRAAIRPLRLQTGAHLHLVAYRDEATSVLQALQTTCSYLSWSRHIPRRPSACVVRAL